MRPQLRIHLQGQNPFDLLGIFIRIEIIFVCLNHKALNLNYWFLTLQDRLSTIGQSPAHGKDFLPYSVYAMYQCCLLWCGRN